MLDKLQYFLPRLGAPVHVYGNGQQTWVRVDGTVTLRLDVPFYGNRVTRTDELKRELRSQPTVTRALLAAGWETTEEFPFTFARAVDRTGAPNHFRDACRFMAKHNSFYEGVACVDGELLATDMYTIFNAPAPTTKTVWIPSYAARYLGKYWKDGQVLESDESVTFGDLTVKVTPPTKRFDSVLKYLSRPTGDQLVNTSDENLKRVRTTFRKKEITPEYGVCFAKFTDGTRTVIVAPLRG